MSGRKYYCFCDSNCKFETMSKEQILAAIAQAAESGLTIDEDAAFITKVRESNAGGMVTFWVGTQAQYNRLQNVDKNCLYIITDSNKEELLDSKIAEIKQIAEAPKQWAELWRNTDIDESGSFMEFGNKTIPLELSKCAMVLVQFSAYPTSVFDNEEGTIVDKPAIVEQVCTIGRDEYNVVSALGGGVIAKRYFKINKDSIAFGIAEETNFHQTPSQTYTSRHILIPCKIFAM